MAVCLKEVVGDIIVIRGIMKRLMHMQSDRENLREKILQEMTVDYSKVLEKNFDSAKQFLRLTKEGDIEILVKEKVTGQERILLYLIGKLYAKEAGLTPSNEVGNRELMENLDMPQGSLLPWLKDLRDENKIKQVKRERHTYHMIPINLVEKTLGQIDKKLKKGTGAKNYV